MQQAFVASTELRPMAQQLAALRSEAAYTSVTKYARSHTGEAAAAAYLALGHAYLLDQKYTDAATAFSESRRTGEALKEYAEFLGAESEHQAGNEKASEALLTGFVTRYPDSIFNAQAPELEAAVLLALGKIVDAEKILAANKNFDSRAAYQLVLAEVEQAKGENPAAARDFKHLLLTHPLAHEADEARTQLAALWTEAGFTADERRELGDAYYNAKRYTDAAEQYHLLANNKTLSQIQRNGFAVSEAACNLKLKRLTVAEAEALEQTNDEYGARRLYLLLELARTRNDLDGQRKFLNELKEKFPESQWLAEALFSSGNLYLLRHEYPEAIANYSFLAAHFPQNKNAAYAHWHACWLTYRQGSMAQAETLFDEQIHQFPKANETVSAIYWRARLFENLDHNPEKAAANYHTLTRLYPHFFYAQMARQRLAQLDGQQVTAATESPATPDADASAELAEQKAADPPALTTELPDNPHLARASLLANAGLNEYIAQEIAAVPGSGTWSGLAEARIYQSYGETYQALRAIKRAVPGAMSTEISAIPLEYWRILFPEPWWETIKTESAKNNLDPYLVASLIRQESEFNPSVVSHANAYGLMQLLPSVGKSMAHEEGIENFQTHQLLDPETNIRLGTRYLHQILSRVGGVTEYALAAYNAGEERVSEWRGAGTYSGMDEFVESIPFTETREYVEAIVRNREIYNAIDTYAIKTKTTVSVNEPAHEK
jgi:soluble lytic murein transglycosylase